MNETVRISLNRELTVLLLWIQDAICLSALEKYRASLADLIPGDRMKIEYVACQGCSVQALIGGEL
jgi:hypothetical protein